MVIIIIKCFINREHLVVEFTQAIIQVEKLINTDLKVVHLEDE